MSGYFVVMHPRVVALFAAADRSTRPGVPLKRQPAGKQGSNRKQLLLERALNRAAKKAHP